MKRKAINLSWFWKNLLKIKKFFAESFYYIGQGEKLPAPLSIEQEKEWVMSMSTLPAKAKKVLIEHNLRLVVYIARKFENTGISLDDLVSIGSIGLIKAVNTYSLDKNVKLATYASRCIENEILMHLRKVANRRTEVSIDEPVNKDGEGGELLLSDVLGTDWDEATKELDRRTEKTIVEEVVDELKNREKEIIKLRFGIGDNKEMTQKEIADKLGISQSYISRLEKKIFNSLKEKVKKLS